MTRATRLTGAALAALVAATGVALTTGTAVAGVATPTGQILREGAAGAVRDSYIVVLRGASAEAARVPSAAGDLARRYGGSVRRSFTSAIRGFTVTMSAAAARRLAANPAVARVEQDRVVSLNATRQNATWGLDRIDQRALPLSKTYTATSASAVTAYVLDSGIRTTHAEFAGRARDGYDFIDADPVAEDCNGHGTHVAGTIGGRTYGVASDVKLVGVRVLNCSGNGKYSQIIAGVDWVTKNAVKPAVANMSLGGSTSATLDDAVRRSIASGVTYALAAGNDSGNACNKSPGRTAEGITVGATDKLDAQASFSNYGSCLDIYAPGVKIASAGKDSDTANLLMSGTSMAAPHVAGAAALVLGASPGASPAQVRDALVASAIPGVVTSLGSGSVNRLLYTGAIAAPAPTSVPTPAPTMAPTPSPTTAPTAPPSTAPPTAPPTTVPVACGPFTDTSNVIITDLNTATSSQTVSGCTGTASTAATVDVEIKHGHRGSLTVTLVAPNGTAYPLKATTSANTGDDIIGRYVVNAAGAPRNGNWKLQVKDTAKLNIGRIDSWTLRL